MISNAGVFFGFFGALVIDIFLCANGFLDNPSTTFHVLFLLGVGGLIYLPVHFFFKKKPVAITYTDEDNLSPEKRAAMEANQSAKRPGRLSRHIKNNLIFSFPINLIFGLVLLVYMPIRFVYTNAMPLFIALTSLFLPVTGIRLMTETKCRHDKWRHECGDCDALWCGIFFGFCAIGLSFVALLPWNETHYQSPQFKVSAIFLSLNIISGIYELGRWYRTKKA